MKKLLCYAGVLVVFIMGCHINGNGVSREVKGLQQAARQGDVAAQLELGDCFFYGDGVDQSRELAIVEWSKAAEQGNSDAMFRLGVCYCYAIEVEKDVKKGIELLQDAAEQGNSDAMVLLGRFHQGQTALGVLVFADGIFKKFVDDKLLSAIEDELINKREMSLNIFENNEDISGYVSVDHEKAFKLYEEAASHGNTNGMLALAVCYEDGKGIKQNKLKGYSLRREAAQKGNLIAKRYFLRKDKSKIQQHFLDNAESFSLADFLLFDSGLSNDKRFMAELAIKLAEVENKYFGCIVGMALGEEKDIVSAMKKMAKNGDVIALYLLGQRYLEGQGGFSQDYAEASCWLKKLVPRNSPAVLYYLGCCYTDPRGVNENYKQAIYWWRKAASASSADAEYELGKCYYNGKGVGKSVAMAHYFWNLAAKHGHLRAEYMLELVGLPLGGAIKSKNDIKWLLEEADKNEAIAQMTLGELYYDVQDYGKAISWFRKAAEKGDAVSLFYLGRCYYKGEGCEKNIDYAVQQLKKSDYYAAKNLLKIIEKQYGVECK